MLVSTNSRAEPKKFLLENIQGTRRVKDATEVDEFRLRLRGCDLSGFDIHSLDLVAVDFRDANLSHTNLGGAILSKSNLSGAKLKGANLQRSAWTPPWVLSIEIDLADRVLLST